MHKPLVLSSSLALALLSYLLAHSPSKLVFRDVRYTRVEQPALIFPAHGMTWLKLCYTRV